MPNLRAIFGAKGETVAKARSGMVVKKPANVFEMPKSSRIYEMMVPTPVIGVLTVVAKKMMAMKKEKSQK